MNAPGRQSEHAGRRPPVPLIYSITLTGILANTLIGPAIPDILDGLGEPEARAGFLVAAGTLPGILMAPLIGILADRYGRRAVVVPCLVGFGVFGGLGSLAPSFPMLVAARLAQGVGSAGLINLAVVIIGDHWSGSQRTGLIGRNAAVLTLALAVFPPVGGAVADAFGWRAVFVIYLVAVLTAIACWTMLPPDRPSEDVDVAAQLRGARDVIRSPVVLAVLGSGFIVFVLIFGLFLTVFPIHLENEFGLGASARGLIIAVPALSSSLVAFNLGRLRERFGTRNLLLFAGVTYVLAFAGVGVSPLLWMAFLPVILYGLGEGVFIPTLQDVVAAEAPTEQRGAVVAVWVGAARAGQTVGPLLASVGLAALTTNGVFLAGAVVAATLLVAQLLSPVGRTPATAH